MEVVGLFRLRSSGSSDALSLNSFFELSLVVMGACCSRRRRSKEAAEVVSGGRMPTGSRLKRLFIGSMVSMFSAISCCH